MESFTGQLSWRASGCRGLHAVELQREGGASLYRQERRPLGG